MAEIIINAEVLGKMKKCYVQMFEEVSVLTKQFMDNFTEMARKTGYAPYGKFFETKLLKPINETLKSAFHKSYVRLDDLNDKSSFRALEERTHLGVHVIQGQSLTELQKFKSDLGSCVSAWKCGEYQDSKKIQGNHKPTTDDVGTVNSYVSRYLDGVKNAMKKTAKEAEAFGAENDMFLPIVLFIKNSDDFFNADELKYQLKKEMENFVDDARHGGDK